MKQKHIHVVYIITKLELGGAQKTCLTLFNQLPNHQIYTNLISGKKGLLTETLTNSSNIILLDSLTREISFNPFKEIRCFIKLVQTLRAYKKQYHNVIIHTHSTKAGLLGRWAAFFARISVRVHTVHGFGFHPYQTKLYWIINYFLEFITSFITTHYVCVSLQDVKTGCNFLIGFSKKHSIIRAGVDTSVFKPAISHKSTHQFIFGTVSCFKPQKNIFDLLLAFKLTHDIFPKTKLEIIGDGNLRTTIEQWISHHNLETHIILHGWQQNVYHYLQQWHAFVLSSLWEGLPCAVVEARLLKLPVISYKTGGIPEVIFNEINGLLSNPKDFNELASHMKRLISDQLLFKQLQNHNDDFSEFDLNYMVSEHAQLYKQLMRMKR